MDDNAKILTKILGQNIRLHRKMLGLSQEVLAERVGIGFQSLSRMERGEIAPKLERLQLFADVLQCRVADLFHSPESLPTVSSAAMADFVQSLNAKQRAFMLKQLGILTHLLTLEDDE